MPVWSNQLRTKLFPNPLPSAFYTCNEKEVPPLGKLQNYFEWKWGDAQFIVLDPFWYTERRGRGDGGGNWARTLGEEQYRWLEKVLSESKSKYKFVFIHHLVGGLDTSARGGSEAAAMYEWGGLGEMNMEEFRKFRPGWPMPIHQLLVKAKVSAVFHG
ncbi:MAG: metallophosphoesterase family protein, partial [Isosphaeraceae bacterium]